jgi:hypothetical protein
MLTFELMGVLFVALIIAAMVSGREPRAKR